MEIQIKSTNIVLTKSLRSYIEEKIGKCERFINLENFPCKAYVEIEKITDHHRKGDIFRAEVSMKVPGKKLLYCQARKDDIYLAINAVRDKFEREIKKYKGFKE